MTFALCRYKSRDLLSAHWANHLANRIVLVRGTKSYIDICNHFMYLKIKRRL